MLFSRQVLELYCAPCIANTRTKMALAAIQDPITLTPTLIQAKLLV